MTRRLCFVIVLLAVVGVVFPGVARAAIGGRAENGIRGFDVLVPVVVGATTSLRAQHHRAIDGLGSDVPSRATLAAESSTAQMGAGASRPNPDIRAPGSYLDWNRQNVVSNSSRVPLQGPMECGAFSCEAAGWAPAEDVLTQLGPRQTPRGVAIDHLATALDEMPQTANRFGQFHWDGHLDTAAIQQLTADGPVVAHFPVYAAEYTTPLGEYIQLDGHFMVIEDITASGNVRLLDTELGESFEVTLHELDAAWSRAYIGRR